MKADTRSAKCRCGELVYTVVGDPAMTDLCHCTNCQRRTGSSYAANTLFAVKQIEARIGNPQVVRQPGASESVLVEFCGACGTTVSWRHENSGTHQNFAVGCFADREFPSPQMEFWTIRRKPWIQPVEGAAQFETQPEK